MVAKFVIVLATCALAAAAAAPAYHEEEAHAPAHYEFQYSVHDSHTGDIKEQQETRKDDHVQGHYKLLQPDGLTRIVHYSADHKNGFTADVQYEGKANPAPAPAKLAYHAAPVASVAYHAEPVAKVAYHAAPVVAKVAYHAAPVAQVAYHAAPLEYTHVAHAPAARVAYTENLGHVTFSSPIISYHH